MYTWNQVNSGNEYEFDLNSLDTAALNIFVPDCADYLSPCLDSDVAFASTSHTLKWTNSAQGVLICASYSAECPFKLHSNNPLKFSISTDYPLPSDFPGSRNLNGNYELQFQVCTNFPD